MLQRTTDITFYNFFYKRLGEGWKRKIRFCKYHEKQVKSYANTPTWSKNSANSQCKAWICKKKYQGYKPIRIQHSYIRCNYFENIIGRAFSIKPFSWDDFKTRQKFKDVWKYYAFSKRFPYVFETFWRYVCTRHSILSGKIFVITWKLLRTENICKIS